VRKKEAEINAETNVMKRLGQIIKALKDSSERLNWRLY